MIKFKSGNLLEADVQALVNAVNCVGVMGKGIALAFKNVFPKNFEAYKQACDKQQVKPGEMFIVSLEGKYIINFPTKLHWKHQSKLEDIQTGLDALIHDVKRLNIQSIAIPALGCGNGGLAWEEVKPLIEKAFSQLPEIHVLVFPPQQSNS